MAINLFIAERQTSTVPRSMPAGYILALVMIILPLTLQSLAAQDVRINNNMVIEADGTFRLDNTATVWNDLMVFPDATTKGGSNPPEWGTAFMRNAGGTSMGVYLWMFAPNQEEELHFTVQIPHDYKEGTALYPHVHWTTATGTPSGSNVVWGLEYTLIAVGGSFPSTVILTTNTLVPECGTPSGTAQHLISPFTYVSGAGLGISSILVCRLYREVGNTSDTFPNAVGLLGFDLHYEQDTQGSRDQWTK
ncbi:MAG: hypothetical protein AB9888_17885 [Bacteroidales bacterium]